MAHIPEYSAGEIIVSPSDKYSSVAGISELLSIRTGYKLKERWEFDESVYVFSVPEGFEDKACLDFKADGDYVEWAEKRDLRQERIWKSLDESIENLKILRDSIENKLLLKKVISSLSNIIDSEL